MTTTNNCCYSERTLRRKAEKIGYSIEKGLLRMTVSNAVWYPRETGYSVIDNELGCYVWGSYNEVFVHIWKLQDVEEFLRDRYNELGLVF